MYYLSKCPKCNLDLFVKFNELMPYDMVCICPNCKSYLALEFDECYDEETFEEDYTYQFKKISKDDFDTEKSNEIKLYAERSDPD
jgi:hypothetical protein